MSQLGDLQRAIPCAHTYLQKNPDDPDMLLVMKGYKNQYDLSGYLTDHEEQPYEVRRIQVFINQSPDIIYRILSSLIEFLTPD